MGGYRVRLRYYPGDPLKPFREQDLGPLARAFGVSLTLDRIEGRTLCNGALREETLDKRIEEMTQDVITVACNDATRLRDVLIALYERYRSPRTPFGFWGSDEEGERIARRLADETGGGW